MGTIFEGMMVVCMQLLYDTLFIFVCASQRSLTRSLFVITKGWCVLFASLLGSEWCRYYALSILFYCTEGLLLVRAMPSSQP